MKQKKQQQMDLSNHDPLEPIDLSKFGSDEDCFGQAYDLSTKECKLCGDSELCAFKMSQNMNITRKQLDEKNHYKDLDVLEDVDAIKKFMRKLKRKGESRKNIITKCSEKFEVPSRDLRNIYKQIS